MKKIGLISLLCLTSVCAMAQRDTSYRQLPVAKGNVPLLVINDKVVFSDINGINPKDIKQIKVAKEAAAIPPNLKNLGKYGVVFIYTKNKLKVPTKTFKDFKQWLGIKEPVNYALDGFYIDDENLRLATSSVYEINIIKPNDENKLPTTVINIWTLAPGARNGIKHGERHPNDKPGVIYIRGN